MNPDPNTIMPSNRTSRLSFPGVSNTERPLERNIHTTAGSAPIAHLNDPRWIFAMRARLVLERGEVEPGTIDALRVSGARLGLSPMQASAIIGTIEQANQRGGFDMVAHDEIMQIPEVCTDGVQALSTKARWITFSVLFAWALSIAGLMQLVQ
ncbi:MAG: hypothetical protein ACX94C_06250 [Phycisphaerales bacterium]